MSSRSFCIIKCILVDVLRGAEQVLVENGDALGVGNAVDLPQV